MKNERNFSWRSMTLICLALLICVGALFIVQKSFAHSVSTTIQVNTTDGGTGGPECRLRDALSAANTEAVVGGCDGSAGAPYIIELIDPGQGSVYEFSVIDNNLNALPIISTDITIHGHGGTILRSSEDGTPNFRLFEVASTGTFHLNDVTIRDGGVITEGGNLKNAGNAFIQNTAIRFGRAEGGAGISNEGDLTISNSRIINNYGGCGGGILNDMTGILTITNSFLLGNVGDT